MTYLFIGMLIGAIAGLVIGADCAMLYAAKQEAGRLNKELREAYVRGEKN